MRQFVAGLAVGIAVGVVVGVAVGTVGTLGIWMAFRAKETPFAGYSLPAEPFAEERLLADFLDEHPWEVGYCAMDLGTGKTAERFADRPVCLASIVKVFCLTELYRQQHEAGLDPGHVIEVPKHGAITLEAAADLMIGQSDNDATQALAEFLGRENVNRVPSLLGIDAMSADILSEEGTIHQTLDKRIFGERVAPAGLPQHGTARGIARYFELLFRGEIISPAVNEDLVGFFLKHPKPFSLHYAGQFDFAGKGGNILWTRPPKHYAMMGWGLFVTNSSGERIVLCVWGEWFPEAMPPEQQSEFLKFVTDSLITIVRG